MPDRESRVGQTFSHYNITRKVASGGMGVVYEAEDARLGRKVALKFLPEQMAQNPQLTERFQREARAASALNHPNICTIHAIEQFGDQSFLVMELLEGQTLAQMLGRVTFSMDKILPLATQIADALESAHAKGIVHRDIKPANIFITDRNQVKILDFGLVKIEPEELQPGEPNSTKFEPQHQLTSPGVAMGTASYMSPEQARGQLVDARTDLFSLGTVLYQMAGGVLPFAGDTSAVIFDAILNRDPEPVDQINPTLPVEFGRILSKLLEKDRTLRCQSATELKTDLNRLKRDLDSGTRRAAELTDSKPGVPRTPGKSVAVLYFENLSGAKEDEYLRDGITEDIITELSKIRGLNTFSRPTVLSFRDKPATPAQIGNILKASYVLTGTLRRAGNRLRITTQLVDTQTDFPLWSERYDREMKDVFEMQDEIARKIAEALRITLSPQELEDLASKPTENLQAYDLYLRAKETMANIRANWWAVGDVEAKLREGVSLLEQAIQLDSKFTLAYGLAAEYHGVLYFNPFDPTPRRRALAEAAINNALALEPDLPEVHRSYAHYLICCNWDYDGAQAQLAIARRGLPNDTEVIWLGADVDMRQGHFEKAIQQLNEAITHDPLNAELLRTLGRRLFATHRFRAGEQVLRRLIEMFPNQPSYKLDLAWGMVSGTGDVVTLSSAIAALPASVAEERFVLSSRLGYAFAIRDWRQVAQLLDKMKGGESDAFSYVQAAVPVGCYSILLARLQGENVEGNSGFAQTREQLNQKVLKSGENPRVFASELSNLAVVDALLGHKQLAIQEAKHASEMEPISKDAMEGPGLLENLAVVYAWSGELDLAFETLSHLRGTPFGLFYGDLKLDPDWEPLRQDSRYNKLLAEIVPKD